MGRKVDADNLVGAYEIAKRLELENPHTVHVWRTRHKDFPKPIASLKTALIWDWSDIQKWVTDTNRR